MNYCSWASFLTGRFRDYQTYFSDQISDRNSWRIPESHDFFVQEFLKTFRDKYIWIYPVTKRLLFWRQFWSIGIHEKFQSHLFFLQENIAYDTKIRYSWWITVAGQVFWQAGFEIIKHIFPTGFPIGILEEFRSHLLLSCRDSWRIFETDTYELFLSPNSYFFVHNSDRLEFIENSRVICFFSQENLTYDWLKNPVFVMSYCSWANFLTSGCEIHIFRSESLTLAWFDFSSAELLFLALKAYR